MTITINGTTGVTYPAGGTDNVAGSGVGTTDTQTLTNKTLTSPTINGGTIDSATITNPTLSGYSRIVSGTAQATTSGTAVGFTGIPSWVKRITVSYMDVNVSTPVNGVIQIGSGSYKTSGYTSILSYIPTGTPTAAAATTGFAAYNNSAGSVNGASTLILANSSTNMWVFSSVNVSGTTVSQPAAGSVTLSGVLDRIQLTAGGGTFNGGAINILYEG